MDQINILVVDDEKEIADLVEIYLVSDGYKVFKANNALDGLEILEKEEIHLVLLDIMMPGMDGLEMCRKIRETNNIPIIMLSAKSTDLDKILGLGTGADDYVVKPFGIMELQARVKAVLRRTERRGDRVLTWGDVELDPAAREVHKAGKPVELTYKEFELLKLLFSRRGVALTRDEILQAVWDYDYTGETRTVDMHVKALRQKLGEDIITTVRGVGYKMV